MSVIGQGKIMELAFLLLLTVVLAYYLLLARKSIVNPVRRLPQIDAIADGVDRAVETGKPVFSGIGYYAQLSGMFAAMTATGMNVLRYTARLCVQKGARILFVVPGRPEVAPLMDGIFREVCSTEGKPEAYNREAVMYFGDTENVYDAGLLETLAREGVAAWVFVGALSQTGDLTATGAATSLGGISVCGTSRWTHQGNYAIQSDYCLFTEDIFAAGAYCSQNNDVMSTLTAADVAKVGLLLLAIISAVLYVAGQPIVKWIGL